MTSDPLSRPRPRLLVSVRSTAEALAAVRGGADIIDVKEPDQGSLGAASAEVITDICRALGNADFSGSSSAALGELREISASISFPQELAWVKAGLSQCRETDWPSAWRALQHQVRCQTGRADLIAVAYADWQECGAPSPVDVIDLAIASNSPGVLFDTFYKDGRHLLDHLPAETLRLQIEALHASRVFAALAGSIGVDQLPALVDLGPDIIAVRSAACVGGRTGQVDAHCVARLRAALPHPKPAIAGGGYASTKRR